MLISSLFAHILLIEHFAQHVLEANAEDTRSAAAAGDADDGEGAAAAAAALDDSTASAAGSPGKALVAGSEVHVALLR